MKGFKLLVLTMALGLGACDVGEVGDENGTGSGGGNGQGGGQSFTAMVKPIIDSKTCLACHNEGQTSPILSQFSKLDAKYKIKPGAQNILVTKGVHAGLAAYFTTTEANTIATWIDSLP